jgi:hypothetical protein
MNKFLCGYCGIEHPDKERGNVFFCVDRMREALKEKDAEIARLKERCEYCGVLEKKEE